MAKKKHKTKRRRSPPLVGSTGSKRDRYLQRTYGITEAQYNKALKLQNYGCALCGRPAKPGRYLHIDHQHGGRNHKLKNRLRGLCCYFCNFHRMGRGREDPEMHRRIANYLENAFNIREL